MLYYLAFLEFWLWNDNFGFQFPELFCFYDKRQNWVWWNLHNLPSEFSTVTTLVCFVAFTEPSLQNSFYPYYNFLFKAYFYGVNMGRVFPTTKNNNYQLIILILSQGFMLGRVFIYSCHLGCFSLNPDVPLFFTVFMVGTTRASNWFDFVGPFARSVRRKNVCSLPVKSKWEYFLRPFVLWILSPGVYQHLDTN